MNPCLEAEPGEILDSLEAHSSEYLMDPQQMQLLSAQEDFSNLEQPFDLN
jgi:hypothetical protein